MYARAALALIAFAFVRVRSAPISFTADVSAVSQPLTFALLDCVGTGHAALALRADYREHLAAVQRDIGFKVRVASSIDPRCSTNLMGWPRR